MDLKSQIMLLRALKETVVNDNHVYLSESREMCLNSQIRWINSRAVPT